MTFFALQCDIKDTKPSVRPDWDRFRWARCSSGARAEALKTNAEHVLEASAAVTVISRIAVYKPKEPRDYLCVPATHSTCDLIAAVLRSGAGLLASEMNGATEHGGTLFQINHVRILEPSASDNLQVDDRLFVPVRLIDRTGAVELRMREKVASELSGLADKDEFIAETKTGALNFCILHSARILVKKKPTSEDDPDEVLSAIIVEAAQQKLEEEFEPNASMIELQNLVNLLLGNVERMIVAPIAAIMHSPHGGMVVSTNGKQHQFSCVLTLIASTGKSHVEQLARGHRIVTKDVWNIPFIDFSDADAVAPEHANERIDGEVASFCTMDTVQHYTLSRQKVRNQCTPW